MEPSTKLEVLAEFLKSAGISFWHFDKEMSLISTNIIKTEQNLLARFFAVGGREQTLYQYGLQHRVPALYSDKATLLWLAVPKHANGMLADLYAIGPVFGSKTSEQSLLQALQAFRLPPELSCTAERLRSSIPAIPHALLMQYGVMLHLCLTGERLEHTDFQIISPAPHSFGLPSTKKHVPSRNGTYALEQKIFHAVEEGDVNYIHPMEAYNQETGFLAKGNPLRHAKNELVSCLTLISRAAIRGGLPEDTAYALFDWYVQTGEASENVAEIYQYIQDAFHDFTMRVHKYKTGHGRSKEIQECVSYLELHPNRHVTLDELARTLGYNKSYLGGKFYREMGMTVHQYNLQIKIKQAGLWLLHTDKSVQEISDELGFSSSSYFSAQFRKITGQPPTDYRNQAS